MQYSTARIIIQNQERNLRKIRNIRIFRDGYEYRVDYRGGFASYIAIDRRRIGSHKFNFFGGVGASHCWNVGQAMELVEAEIEKKS